MPVLNNVLEKVGQTPLVRLDRIAKEEGLKCNLLAKLEMFNAGSSVKDRIALRMVEQAEKEGRITPGKTTLVEASEFFPADSCDHRPWLTPRSYSSPT